MPINALRIILFAVLFLSVGPARADTLIVKLFKSTQNGPGPDIGTVTISDGEKGASFKVALHELPPGIHGFHVHENENCGPTIYSGILIPAGAAGGHFDPAHTGRHLGPDGEGHLGDLPVLEVANDGAADETLLAPHIKSASVLKGHALVIDVSGDNYKDTPLLDGGGGGRIACGIIR